MHMSSAKKKLLPHYKMIRAEKISRGHIVLIDGVEQLIERVIAHPCYYQFVYTYFLNHIELKSKLYKYGEYLLVRAPRRLG